MGKNSFFKRIHVKQMCLTRFSIITSHFPPAPTIPEQHCESSHCQVFLSTNFKLWLREIPEQPSLWPASTLWVFLSELANNRNCSWLGYRHSRIFKMPQAMQLACLAKPTGRYHRNHMEIAKTGNKAAGSKATSFPCHRRIIISLQWKTLLLSEGPQSLEYHSLAL